MKETFNFRFNSTGIVHNKTLEAITNIKSLVGGSIGSLLGPGGTVAIGTATAIGAYAAVVK